jgi:repressor of nif and glnA expression
MTRADVVRRWVAFGLGAAVIIDSVFIKSGVPVAQVIVGLVLMGLVPVEAVIGRIRNGADK